MAWAENLRDEEGGSNYRGVFCEPSHTREARNSPTYIRNDLCDDTNESNDATDPVDDDSVTNYTDALYFYLSR